MDDAVPRALEQTYQDASVTTRADSGGGLKRSAIGVLGMVIMVVALAAPLTALSVNLALSFALGAGAGTVGVIVIVAAVLMIFTAGYVAIARTVVNSGAYYAYIEYGLGRATGAAAAFIATIIYNAGCAAFIALTGYFTDVVMTTYVGVGLPWWLYSAVAMALVGLLGYVGVAFASRVTAILCILQLGTVIALLFAVVLSPNSHVTADVFAPETVFTGNIGLSLVFVLLSFAGYEASACYSEEARDAHKQVTRATYSALVLLALVFVGGAWSIVAAVDDVTAAAQADPGALVSTIVTTYLGGWLGPAFGVIIALSLLGVSIALHNIAARYLFALGRAGLLPRSLSGTHASRGTPHVAGAVQGAIVAALLIPFAVTGLDPLTSLAPAVGGIYALGLICLMVMCSVSVIASAARGKLTGSVWSTRIAPAVAVLALTGGELLIIVNYSMVTGSDSLAINLMPLLLLLGAAFGAAAEWRRARQDRAGKLVLAVE